MSKSYSIGGLITRNYGDFRGVDLTNKKDNVSQYRSPDAVNMWKNYAHDNCVETRPQLIPLSAYFDNGLNYEYEHVHGVFFYSYNDDYHLIVHASDKLYDNDTVILEGLQDDGFTSFAVVGKNLYIKSKGNFHMYNGASAVTVESIAFVPTTSIARTPVAAATDTAGGAKYQDVNMLSPYRKNGFNSDGEKLYYPLDAENLDSDFIKVEVNDNVVTNYTVDYIAGKVKFDTAPPATTVPGKDNVIITYKKTTAGNADTIKNCTIMTAFDNRLFFAGNPEKVNKLWHCSTDTNTGLADPTYVSDLDYYTDGVDDSAIVNMVAGSNCLWVFKKASQTNTTIFYHTPTTDSDYGKIYPSAHSNISTGCEGMAVNFNDDICFMSAMGLEAITGNIEQEQVLTHRSTFVDPGILKEGTFPLYAEWNGHLLLAYNKRLYVADAKAMANINGHTEYEWFVWEFPYDIYNIACSKDMLLVACNGTIYTMDAIYDDQYDTENVHAYFTTYDDEFYYPNHQKQTSKRGCVTEARGTLRMFCRMNKSTKWQSLGKFKKVDNYFVAKPKLKKWKSVQLKFESDTYFRLYNSTLEAYLGSYIKR